MPNPEINTNIGRLTHGEREVPVDKSFVGSDTRQFVIDSAYAEKKGRLPEENPFTLYVNIDSPRPNLRLLTGMVLTELADNPYLASHWAARWDKSIITVAPDMSLGVSLLYSDEKEGKVFAPVSTSQVIDASTMLSMMPDGDLAMIGINDAPTTIEAFLITYLHMVQELIWDRARMLGKGQVDRFSYESALADVMDRGFSVGLMPESQIVQARVEDPERSVRIYGSVVNPYVPQIMGIVILK